MRSFSLAKVINLPDLLVQNSFNIFLRNNFFFDINDLKITVQNSGPNLNKKNSGKLAALEPTLDLYTVGMVYNDLITLWKVTP